MDIMNEDPLAVRLKAWVLEHSKTLPTKLSPVKRRDGGSYGLVADEPVRRGQVLVRVPRRLLMSVESARASPVCGRIVSEAGLSEWQALILHLLVERALGQRSFYAPYLATLPADMSHHPLLWGPERTAWLAGSPLAAQLSERQMQVADDTEVLLVAGASDLPLAEEYRQASGAELVTLESVGWAAAILLSRAFSLDLAEEEPLEGDMSYFGTWTSHGPDVLCLVPWADLLAHCSSAGPESCAVYQFELGAVTLASHRDYRRGEAVADSHGLHLSPVDLFMDYGAVDEGGAEALGAEGTAGAGTNAASSGSEGGEGVGARHRFDANPVDIAAPRSSRNAALLRALAAVQGEGTRLGLSEQGPDTTSLTYVRAALASDVELVRAGWRVKATERDVELACRVMGTLAEPTSSATEGVLLRSLAAFIDRQLAAFPSALQQDEERLEGRGGVPRVTGPERLAVVALASQKRALAGSSLAVAAWLAKLEGGCPVAELYDEDGDLWGEGEGGGEEGEDSDDWGSGSGGQSR